MFSNNTAKKCILNNKFSLFLIIFTSNFVTKKQPTQFL
jgi:hypothetical protein